MGGMVSAIQGKSMPVSDVAIEADAPLNKVTKGMNPNSAVMMLTETQIDEFREAFNSFDEDGGGSIDTGELQAVLKSLGQEATQEELDKLIAVADTDGSGDIDFLEFVVLVAHKMKSDNNSSKHSDDIKRAFRSKPSPCLCIAHAWLNCPAPLTELSLTSPLFGALQCSIRTTAVPLMRQRCSAS